MKAETTVLNDRSRLALEIARVEREGGEISDAAARVIASQWHSGGGTTLAFASTGAIGDPTGLWRALFDDYELLGPFDARCADLLGTYLMRAGSRGPVAGWSDLWL